MRKGFKIFLDVESKKSKYSNIAKNVQEMNKGKGKHWLSAFFSNDEEQMKKAANED